MATPPSPRRPGSIAGPRRRSGPGRRIGSGPRRRPGSALGPRRRIAPGTGSRLADWLRIDAPGNTLRRTVRTDRGSLSPAVVILAVMIFTLAGLVIDGGRQLGAKSRAVGYAQEAARAGATAIDLKVAEAKIDTAKASTAVAEFCATVRANDPAVTTCEVTELDVEHLNVHVEIENKTTFLGMINIPSLTAKGDGIAHAEQGVKKADESPQIPPIVVITKPEGPGAPTRTAQPPTIDISCPTWTIGSPAPTLTIPLPLPSSCTPNVTPTPTPTESPTDSPSNSASNSPSESPGGGGGAVPIAPRNSAPPTVR